MWRKVLFAVLFLILAMLSAVAGIRNAISPYGSQDLQWEPVGRLLHHENPYTPILNGEPNDNNHTFLSQIPNYPVSGYTFLLPLGLFNWEMARLVWVACNIIFTILLISGLQKLFPLSRDKLFITICLFLASSSWRITIGNGQHGLFVLAFFVWAVVYIEKTEQDKKRPHLSALLSALFLAISFFKYTITAPLAIYFVWKRQWRPLITAILIHIALTGIMASWLREDFIALIRQPFQVAALFTTIGDYDMFSLSRMMGMDEIIPAVLTLIILLALTITPIVGAKQISPPLHTLRALSILALTAYLIFFHHSYDLILLIFPLWFVMQQLPSQRGDRSLSLWGGLRGGWLVLIFIILAWHGRRIILALLTFVPANTAVPLYSVLLTTLAITHLTVLLMLLRPMSKPKLEKGTV